MQLIPHNLLKLSKVFFGRGFFLFPHLRQSLTSKREIITANCGQLTSCNNGKHIPWVFYLPPFWFTWADPESRNRWKFWIPFSNLITQVVMTVHCITELKIEHILSILDLWKYYFWIWLFCKTWTILLNETWSCYPPWSTALITPPSS